MKSHAQANACSKSIISLSNAPKDIVLVVIQIKAGFNATKRLSELGVIPRTEIIKRSQAPFEGPIQIEVRGTRLALGRGLSEKILVEVQ